MKTQQKYIKIIALVLLIQTIIWVVLTYLSLSQVQTDWNNTDFLKWVANPDIAYLGNYINATLITIVVVVLYVLIFHFLKPNYENLAFVGLLFIPIYGIFNIFSYSTQISVVPLLAKDVLNNPDSINLVVQLIQANDKSLVGFINGLAYAILGIPSIIYGILLIKEMKKYSGIFLISDGMLCIIGIVGHIMKSDFLAWGTLVGGIVFLMVLFFIFVEFKFEE